MSAVQLKRWSRESYDKMIEAGIFTPEDRVELVEGEIVEMSTQTPTHATAVQLAAEALRTAFGTALSIRVQLPLALDDSEPEPDVAIVAGSIRDYLRAHPTTALLVVEIADSTLDFDRRRKPRIYARAVIPEYWIVNLPDRRVEVYREPGPDGSYTRARHLGASDSINPLADPSAAIAVSSLLP